MASRQRWNAFLDTNKGGNPVGKNTNRKGDAEVPSLRVSDFRLTCNLLNNKDLLFGSPKGEHSSHFLVL